MPYRIAAIDVHKKMLAVVIADVATTGEYQFERRKFGATPAALRLLADWMVQQEVQEVVMESTAQYWKPVWGALERYWKPVWEKREDGGPKSGTLHLAQAKSNRGPHGRKKDFPDAERLLKRLVAQELRLSFVPEPEQRLWRSVTRRREQLSEDRTRLQNQIEGLLEEMHIKLSSLISDLLGVSGLRMLHALAKGATDPVALAALADCRLRATPERLTDALGACTELAPTYRRLLEMTLKELALIDKHIAKLDREIASLLQPNQDVVKLLAEVPGLGVNSAHQVIAEVGPQVAVFPTAKCFSSWIGTCPGEEESAEESTSSRSPKGNCHMRRILNQAAHAAVKVKGSIFELTFRRLRARGLKYQEAIWAIAHRLSRLIWILLRRKCRYEERGPAVSAKSKQTRTARMLRELRKLGYRIEPPTAVAANTPA